MRGGTLALCGASVLFVVGSARWSLAQQEVIHPGETYDSLQAGRDAYWDAEAERRAKIGRQLMLEEQIQIENTWSDPEDKYRPVRPESYGPIRPKVYVGPTLADVYANPSSGITYYNTQPAFQSWPRVPGDIWGTPYYGFVRQPIGHVKIWTGRLSYIYKPVYASPAMEPSAALHAAPSATPRRPDRSRRLDPPFVPASPGAPPPPPKPSLGQPDRAAAGQWEGQEI